MKKIILAAAVLAFPFSSGWGILPGPMKDFFSSRPGETTAVVFGTRGLTPEQLRKSELLAYRNADFLKQKDPSRMVQVFADTALPQPLLFGRSLVLMGSTKSNRLLGDWKDMLPFLIKAGHFNIAGRRLFFGNDVTLSFVFPNPFANDRYVFGLVGNTAEALPALSDWEGDYDYYVAQRHTFPGRYLNRGKFEKFSSPWAHTLAEFEQPPGDTVVLVSLIYPLGKIWYPLRWELDSLWKDPIPERMKLLENLHRLTSIFPDELGLIVRGDVDFHLWQNYPKESASDLFGRVFAKTQPAKLDSQAVYSWGRALTKVLVPCSDDPLDWELFCFRYLAYETFFPARLLKTRKVPGTYPVQIKEEWAKRDPDRGREWFFDLTAGDSTYLSFLRTVDAHYLNKKIGEALDSVLAGRRRYSFKMADFMKVLARLTGDTSLIRLSKTALKPSLYGRQPKYDLGIRNPGELFLNREVILGDLKYGSKAYAAGLRKGDKIISVDGFPIERNRSRAYSAWLAKKAGETLKLKIVRDGVERMAVIPVG